MIEQLEHRLGNEVLDQPSSSDVKHEHQHKSFHFSGPQFPPLGCLPPLAVLGTGWNNVNKSCPIDCQVLEPMWADNNIVLIISKSQRQVPSQHLL